MRHFRGGWLAVVATAALLIAALVPTTGTAPASTTTTPPAPHPDGTCGLCVLAPSGPSLRVTGNGDVKVQQGNVLVDSSSPSAVTLTGRGIVRSHSVGVVGGVGATPGTSIDHLTTGISPIADPLAGTPAPSVPRPVQVPSVTVTGTTARSVRPGVYQDLMATGQATLDLDPGTYVVLHQFSVTGGATVHGRGVNLYLACAQYPQPCATAQRGASLALTGTGQFHLTAPPGDCAPTVLQADPNNATVLQITGDAGDSLTGAVYARSGSLTVTGRASALNLAGQIVVASLTATGNGNVSISDAGVPVAGAKLTLSPATAGPDHIGSSQGLTAKLVDNAGHPVANERVGLVVTGANTASAEGTTDNAGTVSLSYTGQRGGTDSAQARFGDGDVCVLSKASTVQWIAHAAPIATGPVTGNFFAEPASAHSFVATPASTPAFSQRFPVVDFDPPAGMVPGNSSGVDSHTRPFTDVTTNTAGDYAGTIVAQGNGAQAGSGGLSTFDAVFTSTFEVSAPGDVSFTVVADDGFVLGVGNGTTGVSGPNQNAPAGGHTPFSALPVMAAWNQPGTGAPTTYPVTLHFPAAGSYPYELDYFSCCDGQLSLVFGVASSGSSQPPISVSVGYADTARPPGNTTFPFPWKGAAGVTFTGSPNSDGTWDTGALRFDNTTGAPVTLDHVTVDVGSIHFDPGFTNVTVPAHGIAVLAGTGSNFDTSDVATAAAAGPSAAAGPQTTSVTLTPIATGFNSPIGIDYYPPTNQVIMSVNYSGGSPNNFDLIAADGSHSPFSSVSGLTDEVYMSAVRAGPCEGGFSTGDVFFGTGQPGAIARLSNGGKTLTNPWVTLPGESGLLRGGVHQDAACVAGGDLIVTTTSGDVWRVTAAGQPTEVATNVGDTLEGPTTVPNDPRYGPWAGQILVASEGCGCVQSIDPKSGAHATWGTGQGNVSGAGVGSAEAVEIVPANQNFYGVDYGAGTVLGAAASQFTGVVGDVVVATEFPGRLVDLTWDATNKVFASRDLLSAPANQWEGTTFAPAGIAPLTTTCTGSSDVPQIHVTIGGTTTTYADASRVLTAGGHDAECGLASSATAYPTSFKAVPFAADFPNDGSIGPIGLTFSPSGDLYVGDRVSDDLFRFGPAGGSASSHRVGTTAISDMDGLLFSGSGRLYAAPSQGQQVVELDPATGATIRAVPVDTPCPTDLATDPLSGDLFVSAATCGNPLYRVHGLEGSGQPTVTQYGPAVDGIAFAPDGTIYAAGSGGTILAIAGTNQPQPAAVTTIATVPGADGMSFLAPPAGQPVTRLIVNRNDGKISQVDMATTPPTVTDIVTGGTRGDFVVTGPDGCLYATQTASVLKVTAADGSCPFIPTGATTNESHQWVQLTSGAPTVSVPMPPSLTLALSPSTALGQSVGQPLSLSVSAIDSSGQAVAQLPLTLAVFGPNAQQISGTTDSSGLASFSYAGSNAGTDTLVASTSIGGALETSNAAVVTWTVPVPAPPPNTVGQSAPSIFALSPPDQTVVTGPTPVSATIKAPAGYTVAHWSLTAQLLPSGTATSLGAGSGAPPAVLGTFDPTGRPAGTYAMIVSASSSGGGSASAITRLVISGSGTGGGAGGTSAQAPPSIGAPTPPDGATVTSPVPVQATLTPPAGQSIASWSVSYEALDPEPPVTIASGTGAPPATLATFDPTLLPNDTYAITVSATATGGGTQSATTTVAVSGNLKLGRSVTRYQDLSVPVNGFSMQVLRTKDSTDKRSGDFGVGWHVDVSNFRTSANRQLGASGWTESTTSCFILCSWGWKSSTSHFVTVTWPDGHQEAFDFTPTGPQQTLVDFNQGTAAFTPRPGTATTSTLAVTDPSQQGFSGGGDGSLYDGNGHIYDPNRYTLTTRDGRVLVLDRTLGLVSETDGDGNSLTVDATGVHGSSGQSILFSRDASNRITDVTGPGATHVHYTYSAAGDLASVTDIGGHVTTYSYDATHDLTGANGPGANGLYTMTYDTSGRLHTVTDAAGNTVTITNDLATNSQVTTDPLGQLVTTDIADDQGDVLEDIRQPHGATAVTRTWSYDAEGHVLAASDPLGNASAAAYDGEGNILTLTAAGGSRRSYTYNTDGDLTSIIGPDGTLVESATYDATGHATAVHTADGDSATMTYDSAGRIATVRDAIGHTTTFGYDGLGHLSQQTDADGHVTSMTTDALGRTLTVTDGGGSVTKYTYDSAGNISGVTDAKNHTNTYSYDALGRLLSHTDPDGRSVSYTYSLTGQPATTTDRNGTVTTWTHDGDGRLVRAQLSTGEVTTYTYDPLGRLTDARNETSDVVHAYDAADHLLTETTSGPNLTTVSMSYAYNVEGSATTVTGPAGTVGISYDAQGDVVQETDPAGHAFGMTWDPIGHLTSIGRPNGTNDQFTYNVLGQLASKTTSAGATTLSSVAYAYDPAGHRTSRTDQSGTTAYGFDSRGRLTSASGPGQALSYGYDSVGNRVTESAAPGVTATFDPANRLQADGLAHYTYDGEGHELTKTLDAGGQQTRYTWNGRGQLTGVHLPDGTSESFGYDPLGRKVLATVGTTRSQLVYDGSDLAATLDGTGHVTSSYVVLRGPDLPLEQSQPSGVTYPVTDGTGSVVAMTDTAGAVVGRASYDPYGLPLTQTGALDANHGFTGRPALAQTGLVDDRARIYDPATGRFLSEDPSPKVNGYEYAGNDPVDFADPSGADMIELSLQLSDQVERGLGLSSIVRCVGVALIAGLNEINGGDPAAVAAALNGAVQNAAESLSGNAGPAIGFWEAVQGNKPGAAASQAASFGHAVLTHNNDPELVFGPADIFVTEGRVITVTEADGIRIYSTDPVTIVDAFPHEERPHPRLARAATALSYFSVGMELNEYIHDLSAETPEC